MVVLDLFNAIYPGLLSLGLVLLMMFLVKKGKRPVTLILGLLLVSLLGAAVGIF